MEKVTCSGCGREVQADKLGAHREWCATDDPWGQTRINRWADEMFGRDYAPRRVAPNVHREFCQPLLDLAYLPRDFALDMLADVAILIFRIAHGLEFDLQARINRRMEMKRMLGTPQGL